ncbi:MAG TPA: ATP-binding protein [Nitrospiraceae bacterium]|nr:ATP-binding protein [Nitrospiraceae bacterium]
MTKLWHELWKRSQKAEIEGQSVKGLLGRTDDHVTLSVAEIVARHYRLGAVCKSETSVSASHASMDCRDWRMTVFPLLLKNGQVRAVNCLFHEVRDQTGSEGEIRPLLGEAEMPERSLSQDQARLLQAAKLASIAELATGVAHELNNPLNNIGLFAGNLIERLEAGSSTAADLIPALRNIMEQVHKGSQIVNALRTFAGQSPWPQTSVNLNRVVESSVVLLKQQLVALNIDLQMQLSQDELIVQGNRIQLQQVVTNLLTNARDAVISTATKVITIMTSRHLEHARLTIQDTGIGIPFDVRERIFDPFFTTKDVNKGIGLGLPVSYGIIKEHNGRIWCESTPWEGSIFSLELPLATSA